MSDQEKGMMLFNGIGAMKLAKVRIESVEEQIVKKYAVNPIGGKDDRMNRFLEILKIVRQAYQSLYQLHELKLLPVAGEALVEKCEYMGTIFEKENCTVSAFVTGSKAIRNHIDYVINDLERQRRAIYNKGITH